MLPGQGIFEYERQLQARVDDTTKVIDTHLDVLMGNTANQSREAFKKLNEIKQRKPLNKLHLLMANEKKLREKLARLVCKDERQALKLKNRLRMVSVTQSYDLTASPQYRKAGLMLDALDAEA